jgi:hypothetical protein
MERDGSKYALADGQSRSRSKDIVRLRPAVVKRVGESQIFKRRPIVRNKDGVIVWQAGPDKFCYVDESTGRHYSCSCSIDGGVVIVRDHRGEVVEAYKLKDGETVETVY